MPRNPNSRMMLVNNNRNRLESLRRSLFALRKEGEHRKKHLYRASVVPNLTLLRGNVAKAQWHKGIEENSKTALNIIEKNQKKIIAGNLDVLNGGSGNQGVIHAMLKERLIAAGIKSGEAHEVANKVAYDHFVQLLYDIMRENHLRASRLIHNLRKFEDSLDDLQNRK